jgi:hypothetical protein
MESSYSLHVDDIFYVSTDASLTKEFLRKVEDRFGKVKHKSEVVIPFLGMRIAKDVSGAIFVDQPQMLMSWWLICGRKPYILLHVIEIFSLLRLVHQIPMSLMSDH